MEITLEALGLTPATIAERIIDQAVEQLLSGRYDPESEDFSGGCMKSIRERILARVDEKIDALSAEHIIPNVDALILGLTITPTNSYGEPKQAPMTLIEYLTKRADAYLSEEVDSHGQTRAEAGYNFQKSGTRLMCAIDQHIGYTLKNQLEPALKDANALVVGGLDQAIRETLGQLAGKFKIALVKAK